MTEFYMTEPAELPKTLPAGVWGICTQADEEMVLRDGCYERKHHRSRWATPDQVRWDTVPIQPPASDGAEEPKVTPCAACGAPSTHYPGKPNVWTATHDAVYGERFCAEHWTEPADEMAQLVEGRRRKLPTPGAGEGKGDPVRAVGKLMCADCGKEITNPLEACTRTTRSKTGVVERVPGAFHSKCPAPDPYKKTEEATPHWMAEQNARHRAALEAHRKDLDRSTKEREAVLARNTRHYPEQWSTPGWDGET